MSTVPAHIRQIGQRNVVFPAALLPVLAGLAVLAAIAYGTAYTQLDLAITRWAQSLDFWGLSAIAALFNGLTDAPMAIALWLVLTGFFVLRGRPLEALAVFAISGIWVANELIAIIVHRAAVPSDTGIDFSRTAAGSFPSGHVTGAVVFYGLLSLLTFANVHKGSELRKLVPTVGIIVVAFASFSRVYVGAHWASDVLGSYLVGSAGVAAIGWFYVTVREDRLRLPNLWRKKPAQQMVNGIKIAGSIASTVYLDFRNGTATKQYAPPLPVRALYRLAFQAPFPYQHRRDALEAAAAKRSI
ncbi:MAG: phosphatase PAP2 family protein, partial [Ardenticatenaceae bacterium]